MVALSDYPKVKRSKSILERYPNKKVQGEHNYAQASVLYDVLNDIVLVGEFAHARAYEVALGIKHLGYTQTGDLILCDRNYATYDFIDHLEKVDFVIRCSANSFSVAREKGHGAESQIVNLAVKSKEFLEKPIRVRFVRVTLHTGENEVLVTSLTDEQRYPTEIFGELYHLRWGIETFYGLVKTRLELENFSGKTVESLYQDYYATLYLSGLESLLTSEANEILVSKDTCINPQQVNHNVSFHAIKTEAINLLLSDISIPIVLNKLRALFLMNPTVNKKKPSTPRNRIVDRRLLHYHRSQRKHCF